MTAQTQAQTEAHTNNVIDFREYIVGFKTVKRHSYYDFRANNLPGGAVIELQQDAG